MEERKIYFAMIKAFFFIDVLFLSQFVLTRYLRSFYVPLFVFVLMFPLLFSCLRFVLLPPCRFVCPCCSCSGIQHLATHSAL